MSPHLESHPSFSTSGIITGGLWAIVKLILGTAFACWLIGYGGYVIVWALTGGLHHLQALSRL